MQVLSTGVVDSAWSDNELIIAGCAGDKSDLGYLSPAGAPILFVVFGSYHRLSLVSLQYLGWLEICQFFQMSG